jgi:hypothetical protein
MSGDAETEVKTKTKAPRSALRERRAKGATRAPGRPHKRLDKEVLSIRTLALKKKLQVLIAK